MPLTFFIACPKAGTSVHVGTNFSQLSKQLSNDDLQAKLQLEMRIRLSEGCAKF